MKILQVLPGITVGGPSYTVVELTRALARAGHEVQLHLGNENLEGLNDLDVHAYDLLKWPFVRPLGFARGEYGKLKEECRTAQIIQTNSLWMYANFVTEFARRGTGAKSVIMPRGTLSAYALSISSWKKKLVSQIGQGTALRHADLFIATCEAEYRDIRNYGLRAPVAVIPNGIDVPCCLEKVEKKKRVVFLSRIHKVKGVDILLDAWSQIEKQEALGEWTLSIVGPMNDYARQMVERAQSLGCARVEFTGAMKGAEKFNYLAESSLFVLPTHSENWGIAVAEALACGTPAICTKGAPWQGLETHHCGRWIDLSEENLRQSMTDMMMLPAQQLAEMGQNGKQWVMHDFSWDEIARKTTAVYEWLLHPASVPCPTYVHID